MKPDVEQKTGREEHIHLDDPWLYINRELSLLEFHLRVLEQAKDPAIPALERLRFLTISSSILDEFFEIRVGGIKEQIAFGVAKAGPDGLGAQEMLRLIREGVLRIVAEQYRVLNEELLPRLAEEGVVIHRRDNLTTEQQQWVRVYFEREVRPVLTPVGIDPAHPFPRILNKSLNFIISLDGKDAFGRKTSIAVVQAPRILPRLIPIPAELSGVPHGFVLLSSVIHGHVGDLFPGMEVKGCDQFRVTRNSDLWIDEEEVEDLLLAIKGELPRRHYGDSVRLEVSDTCPDEIVTFLLHQFHLAEGDLYRVNGPVNLNRLSFLYDLLDRPDLKFPPFVPGVLKKIKTNRDMFALLQTGDVLLHHPYQSFAPVVDLVRQAARDPNVLAIKQTVYRSGVNSPLNEMLLEAARAGKEVTAVIELRARFDEAANVELAAKLQEAGAKVVYGVVGFKAHAKMLLIVRREGGRLRNYVHLGTGNYNLETARSYTDFSLLTCDEETGEDVHALFQQLTGLGRVARLKKLVETPFGLHKQILALIEQETKNARDGKPARIAAKMNSLIEKDVIKALYRASQAGVKIDLIVRGICSLRPGIPGVSENIRVRSIVGRFLEHHRIFWFLAGGEETTYLSSADWMPRNFFRRVELAFPVEGKKYRRRVFNEGITTYLEDNSNAWEMQADGSYTRLHPGDKEPRAAQQVLLETMGNP
jgi:polyphosphate kinase